MPRPFGIDTGDEHPASSWGVGIAAAAAKAAPASAFHELVGRLCGEHERLQREAAALAEENRALRSRVPLRGGGLGGLPDPLQTASHHASPSADRLDLPDLVDSVPAAAWLQQTSTSTPASAIRAVSTAVSRGEASLRDGCRLDVEGHRLSACLRRIRAVFKLEGSRTGVRLQEVLRLLRSSPGYSASDDALVEELLERLGISTPRTRPWSRLARLGTRSMSLANKRTQTNDSVDLREVKLMRFAELMLVENLSDLSPDCRPEHMDVLRLLRRLVFHQDTQGLISHDVLSLDMPTAPAHECPVEHYADLVMNAVIVANAISIGWFATSQPTGWGPPQTADLIFTSIFLVEMLVKICRSGLRCHFLGPERAWHIFDASIVCLGLADLVMTVTVVSSNAFNPSNLLALRLIRVAKLLRVVRVALFREMKLMINGIVGLLKTLSCALVILLLIVYFLGICLVQVLGFRDGGAGEVVVEQAMLFESVPRSMFTVFRCLMTGDCTAANGTPITLHLSEALGWPYTVAYSLCCVLVNYGIGSLITALVVDTTLNEAKRAEFRNALKGAHQKELAVRLRCLGLLFEQEQLKEAGTDHPTGYCPSMLFLNRQAFMNACKRPEVKEILDLLDIEEADRHDLFDAIDADGDGHIEIDELVEGVTKMGGKARRSDTVASRLKISTLLRRLEQTHAETRDAHRRILSRLEALGSPGSGGLPRDRRRLRPHRAAGLLQKAPFARMGASKDALGRAVPCRSTECPTDSTLRDVPVPSLRWQHAAELSELIAPQSSPHFAISCGF